MSKFGRFASRWNVIVLIHMVPACLKWLVWKERNVRTFEDIERPIDMLKNLLAKTLFEWSRIWGFTYCNSLSNFLIFIRLSFWFDCICFKGSEFTIVNTLFLFINKTLIIYKKKKKRYIREGKNKVPQTLIMKTWIRDAYSKPQETISYYRYKWL